MTGDIQDLQINISWNIHCLLDSGCRVQFYTKKNATRKATCTEWSQVCKKTEVINRDGWALVYGKAIPSGLTWSDDRYAAVLGDPKSLYNSTGNLKDRY